jgi:ribonuclease R
VFVRAVNLGGAVHLDRVRAESLDHPPGRGPEGRVSEVLERRSRRMTGSFVKERSKCFVDPDERHKWADRIEIGPDDTGEARHGQTVVVEILRFRDGTRPPKGRVAEILGDPGGKGVDTLAVIHGRGLPDVFQRHVEEEAKSFPDRIPESELVRRLDLREKTVFTIDPADAKDFDDAVSLEHLGSGHVLLGVHIADVSAFVRPGSALDREALSRGTSVYLVDRTLPMLPEHLSGNLCSLRPGEDRLTVSVMMELDSRSRLIDAEIRESVIRSRFRLTYEQAQTILDSGPASQSDLSLKNAPKSAEEWKGLSETLTEMQAISETLMDGWKAAGMIDFEAPELRVVFDGKGRVVDLVRKVRLSSHVLIEAFMLLANRTVAERVGQRRMETGLRLPFVYRIHEKPKGEKLNDFAAFVRTLGYPFDPGKRASSKSFQNLLEKVQGRVHEALIEQVALRTMMRAVYSTKNVGHFGLAFPEYTHFTSPIRRYPDLVVHRLIKAYGQDPPDMPVSLPRLSEVCESTSEREWLAQEAERESVFVKQLEFMDRHVGKEFDGIVSGVTGSGMFVEIPEFLVDGFVSLNRLGGDRFTLDPKAFSLIGRNGNKVYRLGVRVRVKVAQVSKTMRRLDLEMAGLESEPVAVRHGPPRAKPKYPSRRPWKKTGKRAKNRRR